MSQGQQRWVFAMTPGGLDNQDYMYSGKENNNKDGFTGQWLQKYRIEIDFQELLDTLLPLYFIERMGSSNFHILIPNLKLKEVYLL